MPSKTTTCISNFVVERRSFQSIKYQFTPDPNFFPLYHLFAGKIHIAHFSVVSNRDASERRRIRKKKFQRFLRSKKSEEVIPHTVLAVYICVCSVDIYIL